MEINKYQKDILNEIQFSKSNLLIDAKAGSGKTTTLLMISKLLNTKHNKSLFLAFNKHIVNDIEKKVDKDYCEVKTLHSLGLTFIKSDLYKRYKEKYTLDIDIYKLDKILRINFDEMCLEDFKHCMRYEMCNDIYAINGLKTHIIAELRRVLDYVRLTNTNLNLDDIIANCSHMSDLLLHLEEYGIKDLITLYKKTLNDIIYYYKCPLYNERIGKYVFTVNYTDMLWIPYILKLNLPYLVKHEVNCILVDETQDLNSIQRNLLYYIKEKNPNLRFIFVGDEYQAIYGFAGADTNSISKIKNLFNLKEMPLNICYRCPKNIILAAQTLVPTIEYDKTRKDTGEIKTLFSDKIQLNQVLLSNDIVIGRTNRDLFSFYRDMVLKQHFPVKFINNDLVNQLIDELKSYVEKFIIRLYDNKSIRSYYNRVLKYKASVKNKLSKEDKEIIIKNKYNKYRKLGEDSLLKYKYAIQEYLVYHKHLNNFAIPYYFSRVRNSIKEEDELKEMIHKYSSEKFELYRFSSNSPLVEYGEILIDFIDFYLEETKQNIEDAKISEFYKFVELFLRQNENKEVPIISTIHKMKGGEADNIYIYNYGLLPMKRPNQTYEDFKQEINLKYVALTRAKKNLYLYMIRGGKGDYIGEDQLIILKELKLID